MRKVIVQELVTIDGFVAGPGDELDFIDTVQDYSEVDADNATTVAGVDTILLGAATYRMFVGYWPTATGEVVADEVNATAKVVFSSTMTSAPWGSFAPAEVVPSDPVEHVRARREQPGLDLIVWGSISLARALLEARLVDELHLDVVPVLIGSGRRLLDGPPGAAALHSATSRRSGIVSLRYALSAAGRQQGQARA